jgi:Zn-dependent alcohol dehydrogenase
MSRSLPKGEGVSRSSIGAVVDDAGADVRIEELEIDPPGPGEVLVRMVASGVCHSDLWAIEHGNWGAPFPMLLGHEGAGIVEEVGEGVQTPKVGDPVVLAWAVPCGTCGPCRRGVPRRCSHAWVQPPRVRRARDAAPLAGTLSLGTLATHTVVHAAQAIPMPPDLPLRSGCLLGCGVSTGVGAATQTAEVWPGARVAVIGLGGIGLAALQGARIAGAERLIAVDIAAPKLAWAERFGATDTVDASAVDAVAAVRELTEGDGVDFAFEATGIPEVVSQAVAILDYAGTAVAIGVPPSPRTSRSSGTGRRTPPTLGRRRSSSPTAAIRSLRRTSPRWRGGRWTACSTSTAWSAGSSPCTSSTRRSAPCSPAR